MQPIGLKSDDVSLGIPPTGLAWAGLWCFVYLQDSYFNLYLVRTRTLFRFYCYFGSLYCIFVLDSVSRCCIYVLLWVPSRTIVMLSQFHPHNVCVATCMLCLVGVLGSLLCRFGGNAQIYIVPIPRRYMFHMHLFDLIVRADGYCGLQSLGWQGCL